MPQNDSIAQTTNRAWFQRFWWILAFLVGFIAVDLVIALDFYLHEMNHNNEGLNVFLGCLWMGLFGGIPAGLLCVLCAWLVKYWRSRNQRNQGR
jgi:ABC-type Fe3+ transport system permease subunit